MKVELMNPEVVRDLYKNHGEFACVCYNTPAKYAEKVGEKCQENGHFSGSRCEYIKFRISDIDRGTAEQCLRHEIGVDVPYGYQDNYSFADYAELVKDVPADHIVKNMASFRYIDKSGFKWETPKIIDECEEAKEYYDDIMNILNVKRNTLKEILIRNDYGPKKVNEAVNFILPRATTTELVIGFTPEALIEFMHKRLCTRAQEFIRELAIKMRFQIYKENSKFAEDLVPHCEYLLWCPEGDACCGRKKPRQRTKDLLENGTW